MEKPNDLKDELNELIPHMNVSLPAEVPETAPCLIEDEALLGIYSEILNSMRDDRQQIEEYTKEFADMVINRGDASTSSKEAFVNLLKMKSDIPDKMRGIADLMTRIKLKSPDTYKPYLTAKQENKTTINITGGKRQLLKQIEQAAKRNKENE